VAEGDEVAEGQVLLWLEAMKMQHEVRAPAAGVVAQLAVAAGQQVEVGEVLAVVRPADELAEPDTDPEQDQP
jgi:propionyl-CoA carboxylase alpha chain